MTTSHHTCDPRSDYQCEQCAQRQLDEERELDRCDGSHTCPAAIHIHGCYAERVLVVPLANPNTPEDA